MVHKSKSFTKFDAMTFTPVWVNLLCTFSNFYNMEMRDESMIDAQTNQDLTPTENQVAEPVCEIKETVETVVENGPEESDSKVRPVYATVEEALEAARALAAKEANEVQRDEVTYLKQQFHALRIAEHKGRREAAIAEGTPAEGDDQPVANEADAEFLQLLNTIKDKKAAHIAALEEKRQANFKQREAIIDQLLEMSQDTDNVNREFPRFRELQQQFKEIGEVPATEATAQWKRYQEAIEKFYDQYRVNKELRDYDFSKNLQAKTLLCEEAERLAGENDIVLAFRRLQDLHESWRDTGPVAKEIREEIWTRFKDASAVINKKYQAFFEERKAREQQNEDAKTALCERVESIDLEKAVSFKDWDDLTALILGAQEEWKKLGYASRKNNNKLFARFRAACDRFFTAKGEFYKETKDKMARNLEMKIELCEKAEALKDSREWKKTADKLTEMQKKWKTIGAVPKKQSDAVWTRFQAACDYFFEQRKKDLNESRHAEQAALKAKQAIIAELKQVDENSTEKEVIELLRDADNRWREAGHVPFREKDKIYDEYRAAVNALRDKFKLSRSSRSMARFENTMAEIGNDANKIGRERERLMRAYEAKCAELKTCENNLGFFTTKSRQGNAMIADMERRIEGIKKDIETLLAKVALLDEKL
ncbi:MAG: DUF349 domain-containing protein [Bacteroidales bacterium]|nr:DUF349 domain-containing protein [Bacteroidales bacterium]